MKNTHDKTIVQKRFVIKDIYKIKIFYPNTVTQFIDA